MTAMLQRTEALPIAVQASRRTRAPEGATHGPVPTGPQSTHLLPTAPTDLVPTRPSVHLLLFRHARRESLRVSWLRRRGVARSPVCPSLSRHPCPFWIPNRMYPDPAELVLAWRECSRSARVRGRSRRRSVRGRSPTRNEPRGRRSFARTHAQPAFGRRRRARLSIASCRSLSRFERGSPRAREAGLVPVRVHEDGAVGSEACFAIPATRDRGGMNSVCPSDDVRDRIDDVR
jgi:hypothetical protein